MFSEPKKLIPDLFQAALTAVDPMVAVRRHLTCDDHAVVIDDHIVPIRGRLFVVGAGKAAAAMARGVESVCEDLLQAGLVVTTDGHENDELPEKITVKMARHPIPDERGVAATKQILQLAGEATADDVVLALISGGGSALLESPKPPVTLEDMGRVTDLLLRAGAPIQDLNAVRIPLSQVKGGGLRRAAGPATVITLILSDVLGNDPRIIASGPTIPSSAHPAHARSLLEHYHIVDAVPQAVNHLLLSEFDDSDDNTCEHDHIVIIADNVTAVTAASRAAHERDFSPRIVWTNQTGEASNLGRAWVRACQEAADDVNVLLGGGEATVTVRGDGIGGRNTEFALAAALELERLQMTDWTIASLATDGIDGLSDAAGAIANFETGKRMRDSGINPVDALRNNDSSTAFDLIGDLLRTGPTGTNVNDLYIAVRSPRI